MEFKNDEYWITFDKCFKVEVLKSDNINYKILGYYTCIEQVLKGLIRYRKDKKYKSGYDIKPLQLLLYKYTKSKESLNFLNEILYSNILTYKKQLIKELIKIDKDDK